jgi:hypothetical protein
MLRQPGRPIRIDALDRCPDIGKQTAADRGSEPLADLHHTETVQQRHPQVPFPTERCTCM